MNKIIVKICGMCMILGVCAGSANAIGVGTGVAARTDCAAVAAEIAELSAVESPDDATLDRLDELRTLQRNDCSKSAAGRAGVARAARGNANRNTPGVKADNVTTTTAVAPTEALGKYLTTKKENCEMLKTAIDQTKGDSAVGKDMLKYMQEQYDADCVTAASEEKADVAKTDTATKEITETETVPEDTRTEAEKVADNLAAGLCADGTTPNKYGCCTDETFRDMGNSVFACCPKSGGDCFPPISTTGAQ